MTRIIEEPAAVGLEPRPGPAAPGPRARPADAGFRARFTRGSVLRHVVVMTATGAVGTLSIFVVDLLSLIYVSRLGSTELKAAAGFATQVLVYPVAVNIGLAIAVTAAVSRALGADHRARARRITASGLLIAALISAAVTLAALVGADPLLRLFGARGETLAIAERFLLIALPGNVPLALGMALSGVLRAVGDARRAMLVTLAGGLVVAALDPVLIFGLHLGIEGAAISTLVSRFVLLGVGWHGVGRVHGLLQWPKLRSLGLDGRILAGVALPSVAANLATPLGNGYALKVYAGYGDAAVAASAIIDRTVYVGFAVIFALTGAIGPILGQNLGAKLYGPRVRHADPLLRRHDSLYDGRVAGAGLRLARHRGTVPGVSGDRGLSQVLLPLRRVGLAVHRHAVRRQRRLQQPRLPAAVDAVQLGAGDARHGPLRDARGAPRRRRGRHAGHGGRGGALRHGRGRHGLPGRGAAGADRDPHPGHPLSDGPSNDR